MYFPRSVEQKVYNFKIFEILCTIDNIHSNVTYRKGQQAVPFSLSLILKP